MRKFGLIGYPLTHSFSQRYFTDKFEKEQIPDCSYQAYSIPQIGDVEGLLGDPELCGLNVTIPYKEQVLTFLDEMDPVVAAIRACNCIRIRGGRLKGYNTDVVGFEQSLRTKLLPEHDRALVLGTGGASKAVEYVLRKLGIPYQLVSRKGGGQRGEGSLGGPDVLSYEQADADLLRACRLVINTTPLGMHPAVGELPPLAYEAIGPGHYLFDLIYNPARTAFLGEGEARGATVENGHDMLILQAEESWRIWNTAD